MPDNVGNSAFRNPRVEWPAGHVANEPHFYCAYNQTRERILCPHVDLADLLPENLSEKLALLTPGSMKALWLAPFRGIAQSHVDSPIDLLLLDCNNRVLAMAESFPVEQPTTCNWPAGTALALPVQSIALSGTLPGDQMVLCSPEEMKRRFLILRGFGTGASMVASNQETQELPSNPHSVAHHPPPIRNEAVQLTTGEEILEKHAPPSAPPSAPEQTPAPTSNPHSVAHHPPPIRNEAVQLTTGEEILEKHAPPSAPPSAPEQTPAPTSNPHSVAHHPPPIRKKAVRLNIGKEILEKHAPPSAPPSAPEQTPARTGAEETTAPFNSRASSPRNWPRWLLTPEPSDKEPPDKRKFPREVLPWVAAYFFDGGPPSPSSVRDISMSGMFVVTAERWYLGTIIRFTLTDWRVQPPNRYVTINAEAVRWGDDGVGLRFLFQKPRRGEHNRAVPLFVDVTPRKLYEFLQCFKPGTSPQNLRN